MALTATQKKWAIGGGIGAAALLVGYGLFHGRPAFGHALPGGASSGRHDHGRRRKRRHDQDQEHENERGEYGGRKKHHHKRHEHG